MDDNRNLRERHADLADLLDRPDAAYPHGSARMVGQVFNAGSMPTTTGHYFALHPALPGGVEAERSAASVAVDTTQTFYALILGAGTVAVGDTIVCKLINGRWVGMKRGGTPVGTVVTPGCVCPTGPATIDMTLTGDPSLGGYDVFPSLHSDTLVWGVANPNWGAGASCWIGQTTWGDSALHNPYVYIIRCFSGSYFVRRGYLAIDPIEGWVSAVQATWVVGLSGNACSPWQQPYARNSQGLDVAHAPSPSFPPPGWSLTLTPG